MPEIRSKQDEINEILRSLNDPRANNEPVLAINQLELQRGKNGGYPVHMYHQTLDPVIVVNRQQENAMSSHGYVRNYIRKEYPKYKFRRNMDEKFEETDFIEERLVRNEAEEQHLSKLKKPHGCSEWLNSVADLPALPDAPEEDPAVTIARLQGQLEALESTKKK